MRITETDRFDPHNADLHTHTNRSDADPDLTPDLLCARAAEAGIKHLSPTDHDTLLPEEERKTLAAKYNIDIISGCEVSCFWTDRFGDPVLVHKGAHWLDCEYPALKQIIAHNQNQDFDGRLLAMLHKAKKAGFDPYHEGVERNLERARALYPDSNHYGKRALVRVFMDSGCIPDRRAAYDLFAFGGPAYVPVTEHLHFVCVQDAMEALTPHSLVTHNHLFYSHLDGIGNRDLLKDHKRMGGIGLEVIYAPYDPEQRLLLQQACVEFELLPNMGSDTHDDSRPFLYGPGKEFLALQQAQLALHGTLNWSH